MTKRNIRLLISLPILALIALLVLLWSREKPTVQARLGATLEATGFARASGPQPLQFPNDHGAHPDYHLVRWHLHRNLVGDI